MAKVLSNRSLGEDFYLLRAESPGKAMMGQFYMLRAWGNYPILSRPISVFDSDEASVAFLYKVVGQGTQLFTHLQAGNEITLHGPYGNTFPQVSGRIALVGGGVGIAPLYLAAKTYRGSNTSNTVDIYLGFSGQATLKEEFASVSHTLKIDEGGFVTDLIDPAAYDYIMTCGPEAMMKALYQKCEALYMEDRLYASVEKRMACGIGACLVCSCKTTKGNRRVCKDGPVFNSREVLSI